MTVGQTFRLISGTFRVDQVSHEGATAIYVCELIAGNSDPSLSKFYKGHRLLIDGGALASILKMQPDA